jgi:hypothetical protein
VTKPRHLGRRCLRDRGLACRGIQIEDLNNAGFEAVNDYDDHIAIRPSLSPDGIGLEEALGNWANEAGNSEYTTALRGTAYLIRVPR